MKQVKSKENTQSNSPPKEKKAAPGRLREKKLNTPPPKDMPAEEEEIRKQPGNSAVYIRRMRTRSSDKRAEIPDTPAEEKPAETSAPSLPPRQPSAFRHDSDAKDTHGEPEKTRPKTFQRLPSGRERKIRTSSAKEEKNSAGYRSSGSSTPGIRLRSLFKKRTHLSTEQSPGIAEEGTDRAEDLLRVLLFGGGLVFFLIAGIGLFLFLISSAFGLFFVNDATGSDEMTRLIRSIDEAFTSKMDSVIAEYENNPAYDEVHVVCRGDADGDSLSVNNWNDVLAVYAVYMTTDPAHMADVLSVSPENESVLREVFSLMNRVSYDTAVKTENVKEIYREDDDEVFITEKEKVTLTLYVEQYSMTAKQGAECLGFTEEQYALLSEMCSEQYDLYYASLIGVDLLDGTDMTGIVSHLPASSMGAEVVKTALSKLGSPYVMGAKGSKRFDCSGLVYWSVKQVDPALGDILYTNAAGQAKYCYKHGYTVSRDELQPGDLVFWQNLRCSGCSRWQEVHHTGIYIGDGKVVEASSSKGRVVIRKLWSSKNYPLYMFARPYSH